MDYSPDTENNLEFGRLMWNRWGVRIVAVGLLPCLLAGHLPATTSFPGKEVHPALERRFAQEAFALRLRQIPKNFTAKVTALQFFTTGVVVNMAIGTKNIQIENGVDRAGSVFSGSLEKVQRYIWNHYDPVIWSLALAVLLPGLVMLIVISLMLYQHHEQYPSEKNSFTYMKPKPITWDRFLLWAGSLIVILLLLSRWVEADTRALTPEETPLPVFQGHLVLGSAA